MRHYTVFEPGSGKHREIGSKPSKAAYQWYCAQIARKTAQRNDEDRFEASGKKSNKAAAFGALCLIVVVAIFSPGAHTATGAERSYAPGAIVQRAWPRTNAPVIAPVRAATGGFLTAGHGLGKVHLASGTNTLCGTRTKSAWAGTNGPATCIRCQALSARRPR